MITWGNKHGARDEADATALLADHKRRLPEVKSAYVPSGAMPISAIFWNLVGGAIAIPASAIAGAVLAGLSLLLAVAMGLLIALVAACGFVVWITVIIEIIIVLAGGIIAFGGMGMATGWIVAQVGGRMGKNRNKLAAMAVAVPSTLISVAMMGVVPQVALGFVGPPDPSSDFAVSSLVHTIAEFGWIQITVWIVGALIAIVGAAYFSGDEVARLKFCEPCNDHMVEAPLNGTSFEVGAWVFAQVHSGDVFSVIQYMSGPTGIDIEHRLHRCPGCGTGFMESRAHLRTHWTENGSTTERHNDWMCFSIPLRSDQTQALSTCIAKEKA